MPFTAYDGTEKAKTRNSMPTASYFERFPRALSELGRVIRALKLKKEVRGQVVTMKQGDDGSFSGRAQTICRRPWSVC